MHKLSVSTNNPVKTTMRHRRHDETGVIVDVRPIRHARLTAHGGLSLCSAISGLAGWQPRRRPLLLYDAVDFIRAGVGRKGACVRVCVCESQCVTLERSDNKGLTSCYIFRRDKKTHSHYQIFTWWCLWPDRGAAAYVMKIIENDTQKKHN